jgi:hypothetical protein
LAGGAPPRSRLLGQRHDRVRHRRRRQVDAFGERLATQPGVTLCYRRERAEGWRYNLYCMVHGRSRDETLGLLHAAIAGAGLAARAAPDPVQPPALQADRRAVLQMHPLSMTSRLPSMGTSPASPSQDGSRRAMAGHAPAPQRHRSRAMPKHFAHKETFDAP